MAQLKDAGDWVCNTILNRTDIQSKAYSLAVDFYQLLCAKVPFDELMTTSAEQAMVAGTSSYSLSSLSPVVSGIASIRITFGAAGSLMRRLRRSSTRVYDSLSVVTNGRPATYARWGQSIEVNPPPDSSTYTYRVRYWSTPTLDGTPSNTTFLPPPEWMELMKWETLYRVYTLLDMHEKAMLLVQPPMVPSQPTSKKLRQESVGIIPRLWNDLLTTRSQKENVDEDFGINPMIRPYSYA